MWDAAVRFLREWVLSNWSLKLLALVLSFLLWATYTSEPFVEVGYQVALEFRNIPTGVEISGDVPTTVHVRLRGRAALLRRVTPGDIEITVDLGGAPPGEMRVRLGPDQVTVPYGIQVVRITPSEFRVPLVARHTAAGGP